MGPTCRTVLRALQKDMRTSSRGSSTGRQVQVGRGTGRGRTRRSKRQKTQPRHGRKQDTTDKDKKKRSHTSHTEDGHSTHRRGRDPPKLAGGAITNEAKPFRGLAHVAAHVPHAATAAETIETRIWTHFEALRTSLPMSRTRRQLQKRSKRGFGPISRPCARRCPCPARGDSCRNDRNADLDPFRGLAHVAAHVPHAATAAETIETRIWTHFEALRTSLPMSRTRRQLQKRSKRGFGPISRPCARRCPCPARGDSCRNDRNADLDPFRGLAHVAAHVPHAATAAETIETRIWTHFEALRTSLPMSRTRRQLQKRSKRGFGPISRPCARRCPCPARGDSCRNDRNADLDPFRGLAHVAAHVPHAATAAETIETRIWTHFEALRTSLPMSRTRRQLQKRSKRGFGPISRPCARRCPCPARGDSCRNDRNADLDPFRGLAHVAAHVPHAATAAETIETRIWTHFEALRTSLPMSRTRRQLQKRSKRGFGPISRPCARRCPCPARGDSCRNDRNADLDPFRGLAHVAAHVPHAATAAETIETRIWTHFEALRTSLPMSRTRRQLQKRSKRGFGPISRPCARRCPCPARGDSCRNDRNADLDPFRGLAHVAAHVPHAATAAETIETRIWTHFEALRTSLPMSRTRRQLQKRSKRGFGPISRPCARRCPCPARGDSCRNDRNADLDPFRGLAHVAAHVPHAATAAETIETRIWTHFEALRTSLPMSRTRRQLQKRSKRGFGPISRPCARRCPCPARGDSCRNDRNADLDPFRGLAHVAAHVPHAATAAETIETRIWTHFEALRTSLPMSRTRRQLQKRSKRGFGPISRPCARRCPCPARGDSCRNDRNADLDPFRGLAHVAAHVPHAATAAETIETRIWTHFEALRTSLPMSRTRRQLQKRSKRGFGPISRPCARRCPCPARGDSCRNDRNADLDPFRGLAHVAAHVPHAATAAETIETRIWTHFVTRSDCRATFC